MAGALSTISRFVPEMRTSWRVSGSRPSIQGSPPPASSRGTSTNRSMCRYLVAFCLRSLLTKRTTPLYLKRRRWARLCFFLRGLRRAVTVSNAAFREFISEPPATGHLPPVTGGSFLNHLPLAICHLSPGALWRLFPEPLNQEPLPPPPATGFSPPLNSLFSAAEPLNSRRWRCISFFTPSDNLRSSTNG